MANQTWQQQFVFKRLQENLDSVTRFNEKLDSRATLITGASSVIVGIVVAARFLPQQVTDARRIETFLLGIVCLFSVGMFWFAARAWSFNSKSLPGSDDVSELYDQYIALSMNDAFNHALIDSAWALKRSVAVNVTKGNAVEKMLRLFQYQIGVLALAIGWSGIAAVAKSLCICS